MEIGALCLPLHEPASTIYKILFPTIIGLVGLGFLLILRTIRWTKDIEEIFIAYTNNGPIAKLFWLNQLCMVKGLGY
jgi:hypothetical protein